MIATGLIIGVLLVLPIGGADMPVVLALLNSYAGLASAATGFAIGNTVLIVAGALDGTSGFFLSMMMSRAMNRSFTNVLFGAVGAVKPQDAGRRRGEDGHPLHTGRRRVHPGAGAVRHHRAWLRHGGSAGAAIRGRVGDAAAAAGHRRYASPSIRWPGACRGT